MTLSPIENICEDVFLEIISRLVVDTIPVLDYRQHPPWVLRQVCTRWRDMCSSRSWLWNDIRIALGSPFNLNDAISTICCMSKMAGHLPLKLRFYHSPESSRYVHKYNNLFIRRLIDWIGGWSERDRVVLLEFQLRFVVKVIPALLEQPPFMALQTLVLKGRHQGWSSGIGLDQNISRLVKRCPNLTAISYKKTSFNVMTIGLGCPPKIWPQLKSVDLGYYLDVEQWLEMLQGSDNLQQVFIHLMRSKGLELESRQRHIEPHVHHRLKHLGVFFTSRDTDCFQPFRLAHLPNLQHLELTLFEKPQFRQPYGLSSILPSLTQLTIHRLWHLDLNVFIEFLRSNPQLESLHLSLSIKFCARLFDFLTITHRDDSEVRDVSCSSTSSLKNDFDTSTYTTALPRLRRLTLELAKVAVPPSMHDDSIKDSGQITFTPSTHQSLSRMIDSRSGVSVPMGVITQKFTGRLSGGLGYRGVCGSVLEQATIRYVTKCNLPNVRRWDKAAMFALMMEEEVRSNRKTRGAMGAMVCVEVADCFGFMDANGL